MSLASPTRRYRVVHVLESPERMLCREYRELYPLLDGESRALADLQAGLWPRIRSAAGHGRGCARDPSTPC